MEEAGIKIKNIKFLRVSNLKGYGDKHYLDIGLLAKIAYGKPRVMEPNKLESWDWYDLDSLPKPLFASIEQSLEALKTGKNFFDK